MESVVPASPLTDRSLMVLPSAWQVAAARELMRRAEFATPLCWPAQCPTEVTSVLQGAARWAALEEEELPLGGRASPWDPSAAEVATVAAWERAYVRAFSFPGDHARCFRAGEPR